MKPPRRKLLHLAAGAAALPVLPRAAVSVADYYTGCAVPGWWRY